MSGHAAGKTFGPMPTRAFGDRRLHREHLAVLGAITAFDRFNANGRGCYASPAKIAAIASCHEKSVFRTLRELESWGYLLAKDNPGNSRLRSWHVIYTDFDAEWLKGASSTGATDESNTDATEPRSQGSIDATAKPVLSNMRNRQGFENVGKSLANIFCETKNKSRESVEINSVQTASLPRREALEVQIGKPVASNLAMFESAIKAGRPINREHWRDYLEGVCYGPLALGSDDPATKRAERLLEDYGDLLQAGAA